MGIKAAQGYDNTSTYTLELAIPLKLLKLNVNSAAKFNFHIITDRAYVHYTEKKTVEHGITKTTRKTDEAAQKAMPKANGGVQSTSYTTDFWGEYTLAK